MKAFKFILKLLFVLIFIFSASLNILLFNNSYGKLTLKKDMNLLKSMVENDANSMYDELITKTDKRGYKYTYKEEQGGELLEEYEYKIFFDENNVFYLTYTYTDKQDNETTFYLKDSVLYTDTGKTRTKVVLTEDEVGQRKDDIIEKIYNMHYLSYTKINTFNEEHIKTSLEFAISPFYFLGIKADLDDESIIDYTLHYDLNGTLRRVEYNEGEKDITMTYSVSNSKIDFPDFKPYSLVH